MIKKSLAFIGIMVSLAMPVMAQDINTDPSPVPAQNYGISGIPNWPHSHGETHPGMHDYYKQLSDPKLPYYSAGSCCNNKDCDIVRAWFDEEKGNWVAIVNGQKWDIPPDTIITNQFREAPDGNSHVCIVGGKIRCFVRSIPKI